MNTLLLLAASVTAFGSASAARADSADTPSKADQTFGLGEIVVVAHAPAELKIGSNTLSQEALSTFARVSLDDALGLLPGANGGNSGGTRNERLIYVRGFGRWQVPLTIDGIRVYLPADNRLDFGRFLTSDIAEVQVAKGYVSVLNGPDGMGGAVNLVTRKPEKPLEADLRGSLSLGREGEYAGYSLSAMLGTRHDRWYMQASYGRNSVDHWDLPEGFVPTASQGSGQRGFSGNGDWRVNVKAGFTPNATDEYALVYLRQEGTKLAPLSTVDPLSAQKFWTWPQWNLASLYFLSTTALDDNATLKTRLYRNTFYNSLDSFDNINENTQTRPYTFNSQYSDTSYGGSAQLDLTPTARQRFSLDVQYRRDEHTEQQQTFVPALVQPWLKNIESTYSAGGEAEFALTPALSLLAGAGYDWRQLAQAQFYGVPLGVNPNGVPKPASAVQSWPLADSSSWSAQGQLIWKLGKDSSLHASISSRARFPTMFERFSQKFGAAIPNPYLTPERATNYEIGGNRRVGPVKLEAAAFYSQIDNAILTESVIGYSCTASTTPGPCASSVVTQSRNVGTGKTYGIELSAEAALSPTLSVGGNYTWTHQDIADPGNPAARLTGVPESKGFLYANWTPLRHIHVVPSAEIASNLWTVTDVAPIVYYRTGAYVNASLRVEAELAHGIHASIGARNLLDQTYQLASGYPEPGRSYFLGLSAKY